jgi:hypothetical protein
MSEIRFDDITPIEEKVYVGGVEYVLRETSGDAAVKYDNARLEGYEYQDGKLTRVRGIANLEPLLVSLCLFGASGENVPEETVRSWPARVQGALYARAREISGMNEAAQTPASLEKQIEVLQQQLARAKADEARPKN